MSPRSNYMPPEEFQKLLDGVDTLELKKFNHEDVKMLFRICYWLALRINEAIRLNVEDFHFDTNDVYLGQTKTNKEDYAKIPEGFKPELAVYLQGKKGPLFPGMSRFVVHYWLRILGKRFNILSLTSSQKKTGEKTKCHIFRKSMAKDLLYGTYGEKAPLSLVSQALRHKGKNFLASTQYYLKVTDADIDDYWKRIAKKET